MKHRSASSVGHGPDVLNSGSAQEGRTVENGGAPLSGERFGMSALLVGDTYTSQVPVLPDGPAEYVSADGMMHGTFTGVRWQYEGILIEHDPEMRTITPEDMSRSPKKRNAAGSSAYTVSLDLLLADKTGPINCILWDEAAHRFFLLRSSVLPQQIVIVRLEYFRINSLVKNDCNGKVHNNQTVIRSISAVGNHNATSVSLPTSASSPYLLLASLRFPSSSIFNLEKSVKFLDIRNVYYSFAFNLLPHHKGETTDNCWRRRLVHIFCTVLGLFFLL